MGTAVLTNGDRGAPEPVPRGGRARVADGLQVVRPQEPLDSRHRRGDDCCDSGSLVRMQRRHHTSRSWQSREVVHSSRGAAPPR